MKIIRAPREGNFTIIPNETARDRGLTYRALGVLVELLSHDDGWETNAERIAARAQEGRDSIRSALNELREHRYMVTKKNRTPLGRWEYAHFVYDVPQPVEKDPDASPLKPVDNTAGPHRAEVMHTPDSVPDPVDNSTFAQVRATKGKPSTVAQSMGPPSLVPPTSVARPPAAHHREPRAYKEVLSKKTEKKTPPPGPGPVSGRGTQQTEVPTAATDVTDPASPRVEEGIGEIFRLIPPALLPRSAGQADAFREALGPYLASGWTPEQIVERAAYEPLPEQVHSPAGFIRQRLANLSVAPPKTKASVSWCGECDETNRWREEPETGRPYRCPACHPAVAKPQSQNRSDIA